MNKLISLIFVVLFFIGASTSFKFDTCGDCVNLVGDSVNDLLQIILNGGVIGGCGDICGRLPNKYEADGCDIICAYLGIDEFLNLVGDVDPDPIYICELTKICKINENAAASFDLVQINPINGTVDGTFTISIDYTITNTVATGLLAFDIVDPTGNSIGDTQLLVDAAPNQYSAQFSFQATPSEQEFFPPGEYQLQVAVCEGSCGSPHPYTYTLANTTVSFTINAKPHH